MDEVYMLVHLGGAIIHSLESQTLLTNDSLASEVGDVHQAAAYACEPLPWGSDAKAACRASSQLRGSFSAYIPQRSHDCDVGSAMMIKSV